MTIVTAAAPAPATGLSLVPRIRTALFEIATREPEIAPRWTLRVVCVLIALLALWSVIAKLDIVAVAEGRLVPQTYVKIVQPAEAGIVREILVREGDRVTAGQVLVRLDPTENAADSTATERELLRQRLQLRRIDAELAGSELTAEPADNTTLFAEAQSQLGAHRRQMQDALDQEMAASKRAGKELAAATQLRMKLEQTLPSYERSAAAFEKLASEGQMGRLQAEEQRRTVTEHQQDLAAQKATVASLLAAESQSQKRQAQIRSGYESDLHTRRAEVADKITQLEQAQTKLQYRQSHLELKAPQDGTVKELATTTVGAVVQPGTVLLSLVPLEEPLLAEVSVQNQDIGFVKAGQTVRLKLATYPFQKYGMVEGVVKTVIADSSSSQQGSSGSGVSSGARSQTASESGSMPFKAVILLKDQGVKVGESLLPLAAGMQLTAEIVEGKRTVLEYLLSPVQQVTDEAGRER